MIVVDASLALKMVLSESDSARARLVWSRLIDEGQLLVAPPVVSIEMVSGSCYLALASILGCDLWTADQRLVNAVTPSHSWVRTLI